MNIVDDVEVSGDLTAEEMLELAMQRVAERRGERKVEPRRPWEMTTLDYATFIGKSETTARTRLKAEVEAGRMGCREVVSEKGQPYMVYYDLDFQEGEEHDDD